MSDDGGPAYPIASIPGLHGGCPGMSARLVIATKLAAAWLAADATREIIPSTVFDTAEALIDEERRRNDDDASELHKLRAENVKLKAKIAEFIDGEQRGEREPRPGDE